MTTQLPSAGTWIIEPSHSTIEAVVKHLRVTKVRGRFSSFEGKIVVPENPLEAQVQVTIDAASIDTNNADRDTHLRSDDFLATDTHDVITFVSTGVREVGDDYAVDGELTLRGVTKPVTLDVTYGGLTQDPWGNTRALFAAETSIDREEWGVTWNQALEAGGVLVSKQVKVELEMQLVQG